MKYLLLDAQNLFHRASHVTNGNIDLRVGMSMHIILMSIASAWKMAQADHIVVGLECSNANNWRRIYDQRYKANRAIKRQEMTERERQDMELLMEAFNDFTSYLANKTNVTVLQCPVAEADDMLAHWVRKHPQDDHVLLSSDKDFQQLLADNVIQFNGVSKKIFASKGCDMIKDLQIPHDVSVEYIEDIDFKLFEKIIRGDAGDNIFSAFPKVRAKSAKGKPGIVKAWEDREDKGYEWNNFMLSKWTDHEGVEHVVRDCFEINNKLINLRDHPEEVQNVMTEYMNMAKEPVDSSKIGFHFFKLCHRYNLEKATEHAEEITRMFAASLNEKKTS